MKKIIVFLACLTAFVSVAFAQEFKDPTAEMETMKKIEQEKTTTHTIIVPDGFGGLSDKKYMDEEEALGGGNIKIEFSPLYDEVRIYYTTMMVNYNRGKAMNTVMAVLQDFLSVTEFTNTEGATVPKERYYHYKYLQPDKEKYYKNERKVAMAQYFSYLKFTK